MKKKRWLIVAIFVIVIAAVAAGGYLWFGRNTSSSVHYLTAKVTKGTISQTVSADFALSSANGTTSIALGGGAASDSSSSSSTSSPPATTSSVDSSTSLASAEVRASSHAGGMAATVYAAYTGQGSASDASGSPSPSPTPTPTPSPTRTTTPFPSPSPSPSATGFPSGGGGSPGISGGGLSGGSAPGASSTTTGSSTTTTYIGVVTRLVQPAGATPETLERLLLVSDKPVFAFVSATPLWKNLSTSLATGAQRVNVAALQKALKKQGYYKKAVNGHFDSATKKALKRWQKAMGIKATGVVNVTKFVWMPTGSVLTSWSVNLGSHVSSGTALASVVSPSRLSASASISQSDIASLKVGQQAQMTIDGYASDAFTGRISFISSEPASSGSSATSSSSSTQYSITISSQSLPKFAKSGMTGTLDIVLKQASNVLMVPTTAVSGSASTSFVRVMQDGQPVFRQVQTGMATSSYTEITSGLTAGETVVTGQYTDGANSTGSSSSQSNRPGGGFPGGGGGFPSGGFPSGGFPGGGAPPSGGGQ
jgi:multidrug efflux pump subunit AcrA (membrane-fusion protein)